MSATAKVEAIIEQIDSLEAKDSFDETGKEVLPADVRPTHYELSYTNIDLEKEFKFNGSVAIDLDVTEDNVSQIIINSGDITYSSISVTQSGKTTKIDVASISENKVSQQVTIPLTTSLNKGTAVLSIEFVGILNDNMKGFYRSKYKLGNGQDAFCGCTQFEACDARLAFPCWDGMFAINPLLATHTHTNKQHISQNLRPKQHLD